MALFERPFEELLQSGQVDPSRRIRIMQWNTLARALCSNNEAGNVPRDLETFPCCDPKVLTWNYRLPLMSEELTRYDADLICLEEVDQLEDFDKALSSRGFKNIYVPNPGSPTLHLNPPSKFGPDGIAIFYNSTKFELLSSKFLELKVPSTRGMKVAIVAVFRHKPTNYSLGVCALHLKAKEGYDEVRAAQFQQILDCFKELLQSHNDLLPIVICGDFNGEPSETCISAAVGAGFASVMPMDQPYTTAKMRGVAPEEQKITMHTIDYIFYRSPLSNSHCLIPRRRLTMPTIDQLGPTLLPSACYPSDHLSLVADFDFI